jgi:lipoprotein-anchoring transpeptidase ErfK/SrfK
LGARALYLFTPDGGDSFLRIHGTNAPGTIGTRVSNGCARLINSHMVHLYDQVPIGARVYLRRLRRIAGAG